MRWPAVVTPSAHFLSKRSWRPLGLPETEVILPELGPEAVVGTIVEERNDYFATDYWAQKK
jgi:hypothetical protein